MYHLVMREYMLTSDNTWLKEENILMAGCKAGTKTDSTTLHTPTYSHERAVERIQGKSEAQYLSQFFKADSSTAEVSQTTLQKRKLQINTPQTTHCPVLPIFSWCDHLLWRLA